MTATDVFWDYLKPKCLSIEGVVYTELSDAERLDRMREDSVEKVIYPGIFVIRPRYKGADNNAGYLQAKFDALLYVSVKTDANDRASEDEGFELAERISVDLEKLIRHSPEFDEGNFEFSSWQAEPIKFLGLDSSVGYEIRFTLKLDVSSVFC